MLVVCLDRSYKHGMGHGFPLVSDMVKCRLEIEGKLSWKREEVDDI